MPARHALIEQLLAEGVKYVFGNPGTTEQGFMDALQEYPDLEYILSLQESVSIGVADGYARATGRPAFVQLHIMPGLGNALGMLYNSYRMHTPMVIYAGQHPQRGASQEPILAGDLVRLAEPLTKWAVEAQDPHEVPFLLRRAFKTALDQPRGPVFLSVPTNVMDQEADVDITPSSAASQRIRPDTSAVERAARLMLEARSPVILCGDGVSEARGEAELVQLAEALGARVHSTFAAELPFPSEHPLYAGLLNVVSAVALAGQLSSADLIIAVGTPVLPLLFPVEQSPFPKTAKIVHIHADPWEIDKNWPTDVGILGDPRLAMVELIEIIRRGQTDSQRDDARTRAASVQATAGQLLSALEGAAKARWDASPTSAGRMMAEVGGAMLPDTILFDESITSGGYLMRFLRFNETGRHFRAAGGGLGPGIPNPIGIKLARPDRPVLSIVGDGAAMYTIQGLWTAAHHNIPVTWVIANNASYRILKLNMLDYLGEGATGRKFVEMDLTSPSLDFARIAASLGVRGVRVERADEIGDAVRDAQAANEPRLVDVVIEGDVKSRWL
jgi:benzoylformate decarboxylase